MGRVEFEVKTVEYGARVHLQLDFATAERISASEDPSVVRLPSLPRAFLRGVFPVGAWRMLRDVGRSMRGRRGPFQPDSVPS